MTDTANLALPCIEGSQAQKHVTHNDALRILDTLVQLAVLDRDLAAPPGAPGEGERWIVKAGATGLWAGHDNAVAAWQDGGWQYSTPQLGWIAFVADEGTLLVWNGTAWGDFFSTVTALQNLALLGVGTTADATNVLAAKLNNALFVARTVAEGGSGDLRYKLSKESAAKTLSFLFQDNYSGRAEIGLTGDDDFHFKVSADGATWHDGIVVDRTTGAVSFPNTSIAGGRPLLAADRIYYVSTAGSDSNDGLSAGAPFATIQHAYAVIKTLDLAGHTVTIQCAAGQTFGAGLSIDAPWLGGNIVFDGGGSTIATAGACIATGATLPGVLTVQNVVLTSSSGNGLQHYGPGTVKIGAGVNFGACVSAAQLSVGVPGAYVGFTAPYTISGGAIWHFFVGHGGYVGANGIAVTLTGTLAFSGSFIFVYACGVFEGGSMSFTGLATGKRYDIPMNGVCNTGGGGVNYFPGNVGGTTATGGQYL